MKGKTYKVSMADMLLLIVACCGIPYMDIEGKQLTLLNSGLFDYALRLMIPAIVSFIIGLEYKKIYCYCALLTAVITLYINAFLGNRVFIVLISGLIQLCCSVRLIYLENKKK